MSDFREAMRRVITGDDASGQSVVIIDGGPSSEVGDVLHKRHDQRMRIIFA